MTGSLTEGRQFEAILAGRREIQEHTNTLLNNVDQEGQACGNCGRAHPPSTKSMSGMQRLVKMFVERFDTRRNFSEKAKEQTVPKNAESSVDLEPTTSYISTTYGYRLHMCT